MVGSRAAYLVGGNTFSAVVAAKAGLLDSACIVTNRTTKLTSTRRIDVFSRTTAPAVGGILTLTTATLAFWIHQSDGPPSRRRALTCITRARGSLFQGRPRATPSSPLVATSWSPEGRPSGPRSCHFESAK